MEATPGFEPGIAVLQTAALPLGYVASNDFSCASILCNNHPAVKCGHGQCSHGSSPKLHTITPCPVAHCFGKTLEVLLATLLKDYELKVIHIIHVEVLYER